MDADARRPRGMSEAAAAAEAALADRGARTGRRRSPTRSSSPTACARHFGGIIAVDVDHVEVQRGSITALIGPNGAGKTTFFNLLTGFDKPDTGTWQFDGTTMSGVAAAQDRARWAWCARSS